MVSASSQVASPVGLDQTGLRQEFGPLFRAYCFPKSPSKVLKALRLWLVWGLVLRLTETPVPVGKGRATANDPHLDNMLGRLDFEFDLDLTISGDSDDDTVTKESKDEQSKPVHEGKKSYLIETPLAKMKASKTRKQDRSQPRYLVQKKLRADTKKLVRTPKSRAHLDGIRKAKPTVKSNKDMNLLIRKTTYALPEDSSDQLEILKAVFKQCRINHDNDDDSHTEGEEE